MLPYHYGCISERRTLGAKEYASTYVPGAKSVICLKLYILKSTFCSLKCSMRLTFVRETDRQKDMRLQPQLLGDFLIDIFDQKTVEFYEN